VVFWSSQVNSIDKFERFTFNGPPTTILNELTMFLTRKTSRHILQASVSYIYKPSLVNCEINSSRKTSGHPFRSSSTRSGEIKFLGDFVNDMKEQRSQFIFLLDILFHPGLLVYNVWSKFVFSFFFFLFMKYGNSSLT